jgi:TIGR03009 family protein
MLKPVLAGLAISSLCLAFAVDLRAQSGTKSAAKKKAVQPVQADDDETGPPRAGSRSRPPADNDADGGAPPPQGSRGGKPARPKALPPIRIEEQLSDELEQVLKDWELHTSLFRTMTLEFTRIKYDHTFEVEKRAEGKVAYAAPDKGNYEIRGSNIAKGAVAGKVNKDRVPYTLMSDDTERWVCNGKEVIRIDEKAKPPTVEKMTIPPESRGQNIIDGPLPFLFGMKAERAKARYRGMKLLKSKEGEIKLQVLSKEPQDVNSWTTAVIIIDAAKFTPKAIKLTDATGAESVHVFRNVVVNAKRGIFDMFEKDPFNPSLRGYKQILPSADSTPPRSVSGKSSAGPDDVPDLDLGRTADSAADNSGRKKPATKTK